ncbi:energy transducer TonB [Terrimonas sp. NA20]|uniref:Energy transducer TonB n=1 Tax=Terrimonas ginsenosidimutans TaxID=2908004 RepID=A0ABS9KMW8_9BACT|nr:energy transducer TonB [Terrimonas ginsenosidimutans]MCG2613658.1 energy transducer TonB [Terrimonas ginsenosidimutans]
MKIIATSMLAFAFIAQVNAQKTEQFLSYGLRPTKEAPYYTSVKEPRDGKWYREVFSARTNKLITKGLFRDEECTVREGEHIWYYEGGKLRYIYHFNNGVKDGIWLNYHENGQLQDSSFYTNGIRTGIALGWNNEGNLSDSFNLDKQGTGRYYSWYKGAEHQPMIEGYIQSDTIRTGRWTYFYPGGKIRASVQYENNRIVDEKCKCYDEQGKDIAAELCTEREATFKEGDGAWRSYVQQKLNPQVPISKGAKAGVYTVLIQFVVATDGNVKELKPLTNFGFGMEQEAMRVIRSSPKWNPAVQFGRNVNAYRLQPISFSIN